MNEMFTKVFSFLWLLLSFIFVSCSTFGQTFERPYLIKGEMIVDESSYDEYASLEIEFFNKENKKIESFNISCLFFDEEGNTALWGNSRFTAEIKIDVPAGEKITANFCLDPYLSEIPEKPYQVEYLFVTSILYEDGTIWKDSLGFGNTK